MTRHEKLGGTPVRPHPLGEHAYPHCRQAAAGEGRGGGADVRGCSVTLSVDNSRTSCLGEPMTSSAGVETVHRGQQIAFAAARIGRRRQRRRRRPGPVEAGARPGYSFRHCTAPQRIGLEGHERSFRPGERTRSRPACAYPTSPESTSRGVGIRLEDCLYMAEDRQRWFSNPRTRSTSLSIDFPRYAPIARTGGG